MLQGALEVAKCSDAKVKSSASAALAALDRGKGPTRSSRCLGVSVLWTRWVQGLPLRLLRRAKASTVHVPTAAQ